MAKKVCFFLQRRFAYLGHALAYNLLKNGSANEICAYVTLRSSYDFIKNQKDLHYTGLLLDEDIYKDALKKGSVNFEYLNKLEATYGLPNLWPYLYLDRVLMNGQLIREYPYNRPTASFDDMLRIIEHSAKTIEKFLDDEKPDAIVFSVIGSLAPLLLYQMAKKKGIQTICIDLTRIKNGVGLSEDFKTFSWVDSIYEKLQAGTLKSQYLENAEKFIEEFRKSPEPYLKELKPEFNNQVGRAANISFLKPKQLIRTIFWHIRQLYLDLKQKENDYTDIKIWWIVFDKFMRKSRGLFGYHNFWEKIPKKENFAYYPLHYETETATLLYAPLYVNQIELIKQTARALPVGMYLYVKEHPRMIGYRKRNFYRDIKKIPNVRLIQPTYYGPTLVKEAKIIVTITSTAGWEGVMLGKPVITFGDIYYNKLPNVSRCRSFEDLALLIKNKLANTGHDEKSLIHYVAALMEESVNIDYVNLWAFPDEKALLADPAMIELAKLLHLKMNI